MTTTKKTKMMKLSSLHDCFMRTAEYGKCLVTVDEIRQMLEDNPHCVREVAGPDQLLPLHVALDTLDTTPVEVIQVLLDAYPEAVRIPDVDGLLPLAYACDNGVNPEILKLLLQTCPESVHYNDKEGWTPLHHACYPDDLVSVLRRVEMVLCLMNHTTTAAAATTAQRRQAKTTTMKNDNVMSEVIPKSAFSTAKRRLSSNTTTSEDTFSNIESRKKAKTTVENKR